MSQYGCGKGGTEPKKAGSRLLGREDQSRWRGTDYRKRAGEGRPIHLERIRNLKRARERGPVHPAPYSLVWFGLINGDTQTQGPLPIISMVLPSGAPIPFITFLVHWEKDPSIGAVQIRLVFAFGKWRHRVPYVNFNIWSGTGRSAEGAPSPSLSIWYTGTEDQSIGAAQIRLVCVW